MKRFLEVAIGLALTPLVMLLLLVAWVTGLVGVLLGTHDLTYKGGHYGVDRKRR
jgi:hypothetical protein